MLYFNNPNQSNSTDSSDPDEVLSVSDILGKSVSSHTWDYSSLSKRYLSAFNDLVFNYDPKREHSDNKADVKTDVNILAYGTLACWPNNGGPLDKLGNMLFNLAMRKCRNTSPFIIPFEVGRSSNFLADFLSKDSNWETALNRDRYIRLPFIFGKKKGSLVFTAQVLDSNLSKNMEDDFFANSDLYLSINSVTIQGRSMRNLSKLPELERLLEDLRQVIGDQQWRRELALNFSCLPVAKGMPIELVELIRSKLSPYNIEVNTQSAFFSSGVFPQHYKEYLLDRFDSNSESYLYASRCSICSSVDRLYPASVSNVDILTPLKGDDSRAQA